MDATSIASLPEVYVVGDAVGRESVPVVLYRRWSSPSELAERIAGGPWDTRGESYEAYQRRREGAPEALLAMLRGK
jgi:hypothetical protein